MTPSRGSLPPAFCPVCTHVHSRAVHLQAHGEGETLTAARCDECEVTTRWLGFYRVWQGSGEVFDTVDLFLPDVQFNTQVTCRAVCLHAHTRAAPRGSACLSKLPK